MACARCHDHKYDPFSQREYFELYAFFDHTEDLGNSAAPEIDAPTPDQLERKLEIDAELAEIDAELERESAALAPARDAWREAASATSDALVRLRPTALSSRDGSRLALLDDGSVLAFGELPGRDAYTVRAPVPPGTWSGLALSVLTDPSLPDGGPGRPSHRNFVLSELTASFGGAPLALENARADFHQTGSPPWPPEAVLDGDTATGWAIAQGTGAPHQLWIDFAEPLVATEDGELELTLAQEYGSEHLIGRFAIALSAVPLAAVEPVPPPDFIGLDEATVASWYEERAPALEPLRERARVLRDEQRYPTAMVMRELAEPRGTHVHKKGNFLAPGAPVVAGTPDVLGGFLGVDSVRPTRLHLARWLTRRGHPLTSRVTVNRIWARLFGRGLVATLDDFGTRAEPPTHPELLDHLALSFEEDWSVKELLRRIVTSRTYRQSSRVTPELLERDPLNLWLARMPRLRVDAEVVRDVALTASGLLTRELGGPSVFPPQPDGTWAMTYSGDAWATSTGADRFRRGLYTFVRRTAPYPTHMVFDATSREVACTRRERSNTPLQALALLNDPAFVELAAGLALRMSAAGSDAAGIEHGFRACTSRRPAADEVAVLAELLEAQRARYASEPEAAAKLAGVLSAIGELPAEGELDPAELASWIVVANALLNLDETITKS